MSARSKASFKLGENWIARRSGSDNWYRYWWDAERGCTRRSSLGTADFEEAKSRLRMAFSRENLPQHETPDDVPLATVIRVYYEDHAMDLPSHDALRIALNLWLDHFGAASVAQATKPDTIEKFVDWLRATGRSANYINRILAAGRAAINRAYKRGMLTRAPFIAGVAVGYVPPKGRPLSINELRCLYHLADRDYLRQFILWMAGTGARPDALYDLHLSQIDLESGIIHLNPEGRPQTKKYRPTVKLPSTLRAHLGPGPFLLMHEGKRLASIRSAWRRVRNVIGFDEQVQPYSIRHTIARHLRASNVPAWEVSAQLGHKQPGMSITEIYAPFDPAYLANAVRVIDTYLMELMESPDTRPLTLPKRCQSHETVNCPICANSLEEMVPPPRFERGTSRSTI